ncbi:unnamed protein product, partial [Didymodactylos carnosus]
MYINTPGASPGTRRKSGTTSEVGK